MRPLERPMRALGWPVTTADRAALPNDNGPPTWFCPRMRRIPMILVFVTTLAVASACGQPPLPAPIVSPYHGWSALTNSGTFGPETQVALFNTCKANAGPVTITIVDRDVAPSPQDVAHIIAS